MTPKGSEQSRLEQFGDGAALPDNPDETMLRFAAGVGWYVSSGMGPVPVSSSELAAWSAGTGEHLAPWEFATLLEMSRAYVTQLHAANEPGCPPPWDGFGQANAPIIGRRFREALRGGG